VVGSAPEIAEGELKMPMHDFQCRACGHQQERMVTWQTRTVKCEKCERKAERVLLSKGERRLLEQPIVLHKYPDGTYGAPGRWDAKTPAGAERIEIRSMAEYDSVMKKWNAREEREARRRHEKQEEWRAQGLQFGRQAIMEQLARTDDPLAKDLLRQSLERDHRKEFHYTPIMNEAMEYNASNRDEWWTRETGLRGRK